MRALVRSTWRAVVFIAPVALLVPLFFVPQGLPRIAHTLGAVQWNAPNSSHYGHCTDTNDVMCYQDNPDSVLRHVCDGFPFDCNGDDYFNLHPAADSWLSEHWNLANSAFIDRE